METYKKAIEEIVHPLVAAERRKNTLRRELWAHFCALVEEERRNGLDEKMVLHKAFQRLGTTDEIRAAFTSALPRFEAFVYRLDQRFRKNPPETTGQFAIRITGAIFTCTLVVSIAVGMVSACKTHPDLTSSHILMPLIAMLTLSFWHAAYLLLAVLKLPHWESLLRDGNSRSKAVAWKFAASWIRQTIEGVILALVFLLLGYLAMGWVAGFHNAETLGYLYVAPGLIGFIGFTFTAVVPYALLRDRQDAEHIPGWPYSSYD